MTLADRILELVKQRTHPTEIEIAELLFDHPYQQRVNSTCRRLLAKGLVRREGGGGPADPYRYVAA
jgi:hypothetical protein